MSRLQKFFNYTSLTTLSEIAVKLSTQLSEMFNTINGQLEFDQNVKTNTVSANFTLINTDLAVPHTLGRVPNGYLLNSSNVATRLYNGATAWTTTTIYIKSDTVAKVTLIIN